MRKPRILSETGIYHVIMRGVGRNEVFYQNNDFKYFIDLMHRYSRELDIKVVAYVLMPNHVHFVLRRCGENEVGKFVQRLCISYTEHYFNACYDHVGSVFQSRFFSRPITDDDDLITVVRYIANNPAKAALGSFDEYAFSGINEIMCDYDEGRNTGFMDTELIRGILTAKSRFSDFMSSYNIYDTEAEDYRLSDAEIKREIVPVLEELAVAAVAEGQFSRLSEEEKQVLFIRRHHIATVIKYILANKISKAKLARISGIPIKIISAYASA